MVREHVDSSCGQCHDQDNDRWAKNSFNLIGCFLVVSGNTVRCLCAAGRRDPLPRCSRCDFVHQRMTMNSPYSLFFFNKDIDLTSKLECGLFSFLFSTFTYCLFAISVRSLRVSLHSLKFFQAKGTANLFISAV